MAGLDPVIHDFFCRKDVDARHIGAKTRFARWPGMTSRSRCAYFDFFFAADFFGASFLPGAFFTAAFLTGTLSAAWRIDRA